MQSHECSNADKPLFSLPEVEIETLLHETMDGNADKDLTDDEEHSSYTELSVCVNKASAELERRGIEPFYGFRDLNILEQLDGFGSYS